jgi:hypothetical protein
MIAATTVFLVVVFAAAEFYRFRRRITGTILEILPMGGDSEGIAGACLQVETSEAGEVTAFISGCQMCISPVGIGEMVSLIPGPNGYVVKTPWISRRRQNAPCCPGSAGVPPAWIKNGPGIDSLRVAGETPALPGKGISL